MKVILRSQEIEEILRLTKSITKKYGNEISIAELFLILNNAIDDFSFDVERIKCNNEKTRLLSGCVLVTGSVDYNSKEQICPMCKGKYVAKYIHGDFFQKADENYNDEENMGLSLAGAPVLHENEMNYKCLHCGHKWK